MIASQILRYVLAAEFALGGQARITPAITPSTNKFVLDKASGFFLNLPFIPGGDAKQKTRVLGTAMCVAALLLAIPQQMTSRTSRLGSTLLGGTMSTILLVGEATIGGDVWLPAINIALEGWLLYNDSR